MDDFNNNEMNSTNNMGAPQAQEVKNRGMAVASLVLGILSIIPGCCIAIVGIILALLAVIFAIVFLNANKGMQVSKGMAIAGLILGIFGIGIAIISMIIGALSVPFLEEILKELESF